MSKLSELPTRSVAGTAYGGAAQKSNPQFYSGSNKQTPGRQRKLPTEDFTWRGPERTIAKAEKSATPAVVTKAKESRAPVVKTKPVVEVKKEPEAVAAPAVVEDVHIAGVPLTVDTGLIPWVPKRRTYYVTSNHRRLLGTVKELLLDPLLDFSLLYEVLYDYLQSHKPEERYVRFFLIATGVVSGRKRELGTFIKLRQQGRETDLVLPHSFLKSCKQTVRSTNLSSKFF
ncbi:MAG: hypothetical protein WC814_00860 [Candidatus Paceibacterota bacterium]